MTFADEQPIEAHEHEARPGDPPVLWTARLLAGALIDADGSVVGALRDIIVSPRMPNEPPTLRGFVVEVNRRQIFVHANRVEGVDRDGVHLTGGTVDLRRFKRRAGELMVRGDIVGKPTDHGAVVDVGFTEDPLQTGTWIAHAIATGGRRLRRRSPIVHPWSLVAQQFAPDAVTGDLVRLSGLHKADAAAALRSLSDERRTELTAALDASRLADVLEELPEDEQVAIIAQLETEDAVAVLEEMEFDDATDLLKEMTRTDREALLAQLGDDDRDQLRLLLSYREDTAGGLMNPDAVIVMPDTPVAEAVARLRDADLPPVLQVRVFVSEQPNSTPTGGYLGSATLPRLLREPPTHRVGDCIDPSVPTVSPSTSELEVARLLARYDLLAVAVVDKAERLVGVITVDDVLARLVRPVRR